MKKVIAVPIAVRSLRKSMGHIGGAIKVEYLKKTPLLVTAQILPKII